MTKPTEEFKEFEKWTNDLADGDWPGSISGIQKYMWFAYLKGRDEIEKFADEILAEKDAEIERRIDERNACICAILQEGTAVAARVTKKIVEIQNAEEIKQLRRVVE